MSKNVWKGVVDAFLAKGAYQSQGLCAVSCCSGYRVTNAYQRKSDNYAGLSWPTEANVKETELSVCREFQGASLPTAHEMHMCQISV